MMKIRWLSNGLYSLKNCHKQFGQAFRPPPFLGNAQIYTVFIWQGLPLCVWYVKMCTFNPGYLANIV